MRSTRRTVLETVGGTAVGLPLVAGPASASHPDVETVVVDSFTSDTASLDGELHGFGQSGSSAEVFFEWDYASDVGFSFETPRQTTTSTGSFSETLDGLQPGTEYKARAVGVADDGDSDVGFAETFTTNEEGVRVAGLAGPSVSTRLSHHHRRRPFVMQTPLHIILYY